MKKLDIRSVLIGVLATALAFVLIGAKSQSGNLGDIMCNSIAVVDENGNPVVVLDAGEDGGILGIGNTDGNLVALLGAYESGGALDIYNADGNIVAGLDAGEDGGALGISNSDGNLVALLSAYEDGGSFDIYNTHNKQVGYFGSTTDQDGMIILSDRYGEIRWSVDGKQ